MPATFELLGDVALMQTLNALGTQAAMNRVTRRPIEKACRTIAAAARKRLPTKSRRKGGGPTGTLRKSIGIKVTMGRRGITGIIGPRRGFAAVDAKGKKRDPVRYAHLVEKGTRTAAAKPFLRPAVDESLPAVRQQLATDLGARLEAEVLRARK